MVYISGCMLQQNIGQSGEEVAATYLKKSGYQILDRNYANVRGIRLGEIDIVAEKDKHIVFVEVKAAWIEAGRESRLPEWQVTR